MGIPLVIIQFTWIFRYKPSILGYPHYIIYIYIHYIYIIFTGLKPSTPTSKKFAFSQVQGGLWSQQIFFRHAQIDHFFGCVGFQPSKYGWQPLVLY